ncbi:MAG: hypothetical protein HY332_04440 [Chloroflexi bacterium]|nr:hypothetical protein [Chloroflexota bacterium]
MSTDCLALNRHRFTGKRRDNLAPLRFGQLPAIGVEGSLDLTSFLFVPHARPGGR